MRKMRRSYQYASHQCNVKRPANWPVDFLTLTDQTQMHSTMWKTNCQSLVPVNITLICLPELQIRVDEGNDLPPLAHIVHDQMCPQPPQQFT